MVYSPSTYLISAVVAAVALQMQQTTATSLYYTPFTVSDTTDKITNKFPGYGGRVTEQDCLIQVNLDPTLPNITTIPSAPVEYPDLLANLTTAPVEPLCSKVGTIELSVETPAVDADQDAYVGKTVLSSPVIAPTNKTGIGHSDCATGWEDTQATRKLQTKRQLEANANQDIAKLEAYFGTKMEMNLQKLPTVGVYTPSPWAGPYWPTYQDSINVCLGARDSRVLLRSTPKALRQGTSRRFMGCRVRRNNGVDSQSGRKKCTSDNDCSALANGSGCAIRDGDTSGYCIPMWFGICHAWAPAAILEAEPNCPVTHNGVTFQPLDIKALISSVYDGAGVGTVFTGARFNGGTDSTDEYGRHSNNAFRDLNPAYFHIASANLLGNLKATFVVDVTAGAEVWNQPVRGFKVYEQTSMTPKKAAHPFYGLQKYPWNAAAKKIVYVKSRLSWIVETYTDGGLVASGEINKYTTGKYYTYLLELDSAGNIIGGEWVYDSDEDHPDFLWLPKAKPAANTVTSVGLSYADVSMLLKKSAACTA
uniref:Transglutaminase elicitor n=1 Tax=Phytophthora cinnamomi TaxID=4785 RepID=B0B0Q5_PHYCI|nr:transglutaminase elicitor precursor [Phytophthora cinnamomi]